MEKVTAVPRSWSHTRVQDCKATLLPRCTCTQRRTRGGKSADEDPLTELSEAGPNTGVKDKQRPPRLGDSRARLPARPPATWWDLLPWVHLTVDSGRLLGVAHILMWKENL